MKTRRTLVGWLRNGFENRTTLYKLLDSLIFLSANFEHCPESLFRTIVVQSYLQSLGCEGTFLGTTRNLSTLSLPHLLKASQRVYFT